MSLLFITIFVVLVAEIALQGTWNSRYLTTGLPIFKMKIRVESISSPIPAIDEIEEMLRHAASPRLVFHAVDEKQLAFRERLWSFRLIQSTPVMRGLIRCDPINREIVVVGYVYWITAVIISGWCIVWALSIGQLRNMQFFWVYFLLPIPVMLCLYWIQARTFREIGRLVAKLWEGERESTCRSGKT